MSRPNAATRGDDGYDVLPVDPYWISSKKS